MKDQCMPYFKWIGVDRIGTTKKGKHAAHSPHELSELLFKRNIALLQCKPIYTPSILWPIDAKIKGDLFAQKAKLLRAGVLLPRAVEISAEQSCNPFVYDALYQVNSDIQHGISFGKALEKHPALCDR